MIDRYKVFEDISFHSLSKVLDEALSRQEVDQFLGFPGILESLDIRHEFSHELGQLLNSKISVKANWMNILKFKGIENQFPWHKDDQFEGQFVGIFWMMGEPGKGGSLSIRLDEDAVEDISFSPGKLVVFQKSLFHQVQHYSGSIPRISLNFVF